VYTCSCPTSVVGNVCLQPGLPPAPCLVSAAATGTAAARTAVYATQRPRSSLRDLACPSWQEKAVSAWRACSLRAALAIRACPACRSGELHHSAKLVASATRSLTSSLASLSHNFSGCTASSCLAHRAPAHGLFRGRQRARAARSCHKIASRRPASTARSIAPQPPLPPQTQQHSSTILTLALCVVELNNPIEARATDARPGSRPAYVQEHDQASAWPVALGAARRRPARATNSCAALSQTFPSRRTQWATHGRPAYMGRSTSRRARGTSLLARLDAGAEQSRPVQPLAIQ
jgi:hypothetical protein